MNIKKLILICLLAIMSISSVSAVTSLTGCGKNSGWVNGETYTLDFSTIPNSNPNSYCFYIPTSQSNIVFQGTDNTIVIEDIGMSRFILTGGNTNVNGITFKDFKLVDNTITVQSFLEPSMSNVYGYIGATIENVELSGVNNFIRFPSNARFSSSTIIDSKFLGMDKLVNVVQAGRTFNGLSNTISNSIIELTDFGGVSSQINNLQFNVINSVMYNPQGGVISNLLTNNINSYTSSLLGGYINVDSDNNNIADFQLDSKFVGSKISLQVQNLNFIQDFKESTDIYDSHLDNNLSNIYLNEETLLSSNLGSYFTNPNGELNEFIGDLNIEKQNNLAINTGINCGMYSSTKCIITDTNSLVAVTSNKFRGLINVGGGIIKNTDISKSASSNSNLISNIVDTYMSNLEITENLFTKNDDRVDDDNNELINLKVNNLNFNNNELQVIYSSLQSYEFMNIESTTPNKNKITENYFHQNSVAFKTTQQVFNNLAETTFSNNKLGVGIVISDSPKTNLEINPLVPIEHSGSIYYFQIGNFYEDNVGCVDGDSNGICDSPYTSGAIVDQFPLASYPYVYLSHLSDAVSVVISGAFNINLNIVDNQTFTLTNLATDTINISFNHDSDFPDLTCSYIVDGSSITDFTNVENTIEHNLLISSLTEKTYSYRVECLNDFIFQASPEITFDVVLDSGNTGGNDGNNTGGTGGSTTGSGDINVDLFSGTISETNDDVSTFLGNIINFIFNMAVPLSIIFIILLSLFAIIIVVA